MSTKRSEQHLEDSEVFPLWRKIKEIKKHFGRRSRNYQELTQNCVNEAKYCSFLNRVDGLSLRDVEELGVALLLL